MSLTAWNRNRREAAAKAEAEEGKTEKPSGDLPEWPLKSKTWEDYIAEHGEKSEEELSDSVKKNLEIARQYEAAAKAEAEEG